MSDHATKVIAERWIEFLWITRTLDYPEKIEANRVDPTLLHARAHIPNVTGECCVWSIIISLHPGISSPGISTERTGENDEGAFRPGGRCPVSSS